MSHDARILRLWVKALKQMPGSPAQKKTLQEVEELKNRYPVNKTKTISR